MQAVIGVVAALGWRIEETAPGRPNCLSRDREMACGVTDGLPVLSSAYLTDKAATNLQSLMKSAPANVRGADLVISGVDDESSIIINFSFPKLDGNKLVQQAQKPVESF